MSTFRTYQTYTPTIYFWATVRKNNGKPENNLDIRVSVYDSSNNAEQIFSMPEIGSTGYYKFTWQPNFTTDKSFFATIYLNRGVDKKNVIDTIDIIVNNNVFEREEKIDENDGKAI